MKKTTILLLVITSLFSKKIPSVKSYYNKLIHMNQQQVQTFDFIWFNAKKINFQYTLTAIALVESEIGLHKLNLADPSCGIFHKLATEYAKDLGYKPNYWNSSRLCEKLYRNDALAYKVAENDFLKYYTYWLDKKRNSVIAWKYAIMTYNAGPKWWRNKRIKMKAREYYLKVRNAIKAIKIFMKRRFNEN